MLYLILPRGNNFGWGICGKYLVKELSEYARVKYITDPFRINDIGDEMDFHFLKSKLITDSERSGISTGSVAKVAHPILQAIADQTLRPWGVNLKGTFKAGYTFFEESILLPECIEGGRENYDILVTGSTWCEHVLREHGLDQVTTIIQGVDPALFHPLFNEKEFFKDRFIIFSGGKFEFRKGQDLVIKAYKIFQDRHRDALLVNAWFNPWIDSMKTMAASPHIHFQIRSEEYLTTINHILRSNGIDLDRVVTMLPRPNAAMARLYRNTDVGLFPNRCEGGTNLVLMEYMACGKPVIASYSTGHKDILNEENSIKIEHLKPLIIKKDHRPVAVWDEPDIEEILCHLEWAYDHREESASLGKEAGEYMRRHTWRHTAERFYEILNSNGLAEFH